MARGKAVGVLSFSCPCLCADHLWAIVAPGMGDIGDGGRSLWVSLPVRTGGEDLISFAF